MPCVNWTFAGRTFQRAISGNAIVIPWCFGGDNVYNALALFADNGPGSDNKTTIISPRDLHVITAFRADEIEVATHQIPPLLHREENQAYQISELKLHWAYRYLHRRNDGLIFSITNRLLLGDGN